MNRHTLQFSVFPAILIAAGLFSLAATTARAEDCPCITPSPCNDDSEASNWVFEPSYFSHDPATGKRVAQYAPLPKVYLRQDPTYQESGFHYTQHLLRGPGGSLDAYHLVQTWGNGDRIRPYGEWQRPYRAGATPYGPWGNAQGPWTMPFDSWQNPYGLGRLRNPPWMTYPAPYSIPYGDQGNGSMPMPGPYDNGYYNQNEWGGDYGDEGEE
jgi:hypothetical protein